MASEKRLHTPRIIIHGGAGNVTRQNLPPALWKQHQDALLAILHSTDALLRDATDALTAAVHAVTLFERNPLYNAGVGAVFTRTGTIELEASIMVSHGKRKRGAAVSLIKHVKHPVQLAAEILKRGEEDDGDGAQGHVHLSGPSVEELASAWGLDMCEESHFWTRKRWEEHRRGLERGKNTGDHCLLDNQRKHEPWERAGKMDNGFLWPEDDPSWNGQDYLPQGTVGCVVLDRYGTVAVATSTGGITNKLPGRIGDTPTFGAGFWADKTSTRKASENVSNIAPTLMFTAFWRDLNPRRLLSQCMARYSRLYDCDNDPPEIAVPTTLGMSGTGNGDSFLRLSAARAVAAMVEFTHGVAISLQLAITGMAGPGGMLQHSAGNRWGKTGEGEGGIIGIVDVDGYSSVAADFNCGGLFRAWIDAAGNAHSKVFREDY